MGGMRRPLVLLAVLAVVVGGVAWWLEAPTGDAAPPVVRGGTRADGAGMTAPEGVSRPAPLPTSTVEPLAPLAARGDPASPATRVGRRVSGRVVRASDGSPFVAPVRVSYHFPDFCEEGDASRRASAWAESLGADEVDLDKPWTSGSPSWAPRPFRTTTSGGRFVLDHVPPDADRLRVPAYATRSEGFVTQRPGEAVVDIPVGEDDVHGLVVRLDTGWALRGLVTDGYGTPVADAEVELHGFGTTTAEDGTFLLRDVMLPDDARKAWCRASAPGHVPDVEELLVPGEPAVAGPVHLVLATAGAIEGRVTDARGAPVAGAGLSVVGRMSGVFEPWDRWVEPAWSDADGRYRIDVAPPGRLLVSAREPDDGAARQVPDVLVHAGETTWLDVVFVTGSRVGGRVTDETGRPVEGVLLELERVARWPADPDDTGGDVTLETPDGWERTSHRHWETGPDGARRLFRERRTDLAETVTDADGEWRVDRVLPGLLRFGVGAVPDERLRAPPARDVLVPEGGAPVVVDLVLLSGATVRGTVRDAGGLPVAGYRLEAFLDGRPDAEAATDADGRFELSGLPDERVYLDGDHPEYRSWSGWAEPGDEPLDLVVEPRERLHVRVVDAATGAPLRRYLLVMNAAGASVMHTVESDEGRFDDLVDGSDPRELGVHADGYASWTAADVRAGDTSEERPIEVRLTQP